MHEFSIAESIVSAVLTEVSKVEGREQLRLEKVRVVIGPLRGIVPESLNMAWEMLTDNTAVQGAVLEIVPAPVHLECTKCDWKADRDEMVFECESCGSPALRPTGGMELYLESLEVIRRDDNPAQKPPAS